jgi:hypothetical protein
MVEVQKPPVKVRERMHYCVSQKHNVEHLATLLLIVTFESAFTLGVSHVLIQLMVTLGLFGREASLLLMFPEIV